MAQAPSSDARFQRIFSAHLPAVQRYCLRRLSVADANDAVSEVFLVAWRRLDEVPDEAETIAWLLGVARNAVRNISRSARRSERLTAKVADEPPRYAQSPEAQVVRSSEYAEVAEALASLGERDREVIRLRAWDELTVPQIATVLGCSVAAAQKRVNRASARLAAATQRRSLVRPRLMEDRRTES